MTLRIRPVRLGNSVYVRVPNDIADLVEMGTDAQVTLNLEQRDEDFLLIYSVAKSSTHLHEEPSHPAKVAPLSQVPARSGAPTPK